ncbi:hypothetical protein ACHMW4_03920 [Mesorhizobium sp. UC22_110]|uniref:hypothetical protein n=1 Tax=unclassified Mesorhizobium TaxID=325217 RepID=UPI00366E88E7
MTDFPDIPPAERITQTLGAIMLVQSAIIAELMRKGVFDHDSIEAMKTTFDTDTVAGKLAFDRLKPFEKKAD